MPTSLGVRSLNYGSPLNPLAPLNRGLLGWWQALPLSMGGSTFEDLTGRASMALTNFGASTATAGWGATRRLGGWGELRWPAAATAQGSLVAIPALRNAAAVTLAGWAWQQTLDVQGYLWNQFTSSLTQWAMETWTDGFLYIELNPGTATYGSLDYSTVMAAQTWTHLAVVFDGSGATNAEKLKLYVNGVPKTLTSYGGTIPTTWPDVSTQPIIFGRSGAPSAAWNGKLDDWRLWLRALSASEVMDLYRSSRQGSAQELNWLTWPPGWAGAAAVAPGAGIVRQMMQHAA